MPCDMFMYGVRMYTRHILFHYQQQQTTAARGQSCTLQQVCVFTSVYDLPVCSFLRLACLNMELPCLLPGSDALTHAW